MEEDRGDLRALISVEAGAAFVDFEGLVNLSGMKSTRLREDLGVGWRDVVASSKRVF